MAAAPTQTSPASSSPSPRAHSPPLNLLVTNPSPPLNFRRSSLLMLSLATVALKPPPFAFALSLGISGPKEWLRNQKRKTAKFILAPIEASRGSLRDAYLILTAHQSGYEGQTGVGGNVRELLMSAARDCVPEDRNSIVAFQAKTGVEVCTFNLLVKNAASLLDDRDPIKLETEARLDELIRAFSSLGNLVDRVDLQLLSDRQKVEAGLKETMSALDNFEQGIKNCLGV